MARVFSRSLINTLLAIHFVCGMYVVFIVPISSLADSLSYANGYYLANSGSFETISISFLATNISRLLSIQGSGIVTVLLKTIMLDRINNRSHELFRAMLLIYFLPGSLLFTAYPNKDSILLLAISSLLLVRRNWVKNAIIFVSVILKPFVVLIKTTTLNRRISVLLVLVFSLVLYFAIEKGIILQFFYYLDVHLNNEGDSTYGVDILGLSAIKLFLYLVEIAITGIPITFIKFNGTALLMLIQHLFFWSMIIMYSLRRGRVLVTTIKFIGSSLILLVPFSLFNAGAALRYSVLYYLVFLIYQSFEYSNRNQ